MLKIYIEKIVENYMKKFGIPILKRNNQNKYYSSTTLSSSSSYNYPDKNIDSEEIKNIQLYNNREKNSKEHFDLFLFNNIIHILKIILLIKILS